MASLNSELNWSSHRSLLWSLVWRVLIVLSVGLGCGWLFGYTGWWLAAGLLIMLLLELAHLWQLDHWLRHRSVLPPPDLDGPWGDVISIVARIYRRKQYHKQRAHNLLREFQRLAAGMTDGTILLGSNNELLWFNQRAERWLGLRRRRDIGNRIENLVRYPAFVDYLTRGDFSEAVTIHQSNDIERWLSLYMVQAPGAAQRLLVVRDITREMQVEIMRKDFVANASHELRSPLTVISGYLDALAEDDALDPMWQQPVQEMRRQAARMHSLIEELLRLSRLEESGAVAGKQCVDVPGLLGLLRKEVLALPVRPATIEFKVDSDACLLGAETELQSLFSNLVTNAVKYTPVEGSVTVRWWTDADGGHLSVSDTGIGIAAEHLPRLTERFYRVDAGRSREMGGFGLGLAIVKHVLQRHEGTLSVESELGKGSCFTCHFPLDRLTAKMYPAA